MLKLSYKDFKLIGVICFLLFFLLVRCSEKHATTFIQDIPDNLNTNSYKKLKKDFITQMGIDQIVSGYNGTQMRIIIGYPHSDTGHLLIFRNNGSNWTANFFEYHYGGSNEPRSKITNRELPILKNPKSGWNPFVKKLNDFGIMDLPDYSNISDYELPTDASSIVFEIATRTKYRIYSYPAISVYRNRIKEVDSVERIILLIEKEFNFKARKI